MNESGKGGIVVGKSERNGDIHSMSQEVPKYRRRLRRTRKDPLSRVQEYKEEGSPKWRENRSSVLPLGLLVSGTAGGSGSRVECGLVR